MKAPDYKGIKKALEDLQACGVISYFVNDNNLTYKGIPVQGILIPMQVDTSTATQSTKVIV